VDELKHRVLRLFAECECLVTFSVEKLSNPKHYGEISGKQIVVNSRKGHMTKMVETLIHEAIHILEPEWAHRVVYRAEQQVLAAITMPERQRVLFLALDNGYWRD